MVDWVSTPHPRSCPLQCLPSSFPALIPGCSSVPLSLPGALAAWSEAGALLLQAGDPQLAADSPPAGSASPLGPGHHGKPPSPLGHTVFKVKLKQANAPRRPPAEAGVHGLHSGFHQPSQSLSSISGSWGLLNLHPSSQTKNEPLPGDHLPQRRERAPRPPGQAAKRRNKHTAVLSFDSPPRLPSPRGSPEIPLVTCHSPSQAKPAQEKPHFCHPHLQAPS